MSIDRSTLPKPSELTMQFNHFYNIVAITMIKCTFLRTSVTVRMSWLRWGTQKHTLWHLARVCKEPKGSHPDLNTWPELIQSRFRFDPDTVYSMLGSLKTLPHKGLLIKEQRNWVTTLVDTTAYVFFLTDCWHRSIHQHLAMNLSWPFTCCHINSRNSSTAQLNSSEACTSACRGLVSHLQVGKSNGCFNPNQWKVEQDHIYLGYKSSGGMTGSLEGVAWSTINTNNCSAQVSFLLSLELHHDKRSKM